MRVCVGTWISVRECECMCVMYMDTGLISVGHEPHAETKVGFLRPAAPKSQFQARRRRGSHRAAAAIAVIPKANA